MSSSRTKPKPLKSPSKSLSSGNSVQNFPFLFTQSTFRPPSRTVRLPYLYTLSYWMPSRCYPATTTPNSSFHHSLLGPFLPSLAHGHVNYTSVIPVSGGDERNRREGQRDSILRGGVGANVWFLRIKQSDSRIPSYSSTRGKEFHTEFRVVEVLRWELLGDGSYLRWQSGCETLDVTTKNSGVHSYWTEMSLWNSRTPNPHTQCTITNYLWSFLLRKFKPKVLYTAPKQFSNLSGPKLRSKYRSMINHWDPFKILEKLRSQKSRYFTHYRSWVSDDTSVPTPTPGSLRNPRKVVTPKPVRRCRPSADSRHVDLPLHLLDCTSPGHQLSRVD